MTPSYLEAKRAASSRCGIGLGLRWDFLGDVLSEGQLDVSFWEVSPENYMERGGYFPEALERLREKYEFLCHGLTMSVGAVDGPSRKYLDGVRSELERMASPWHSDHLCLSTAGPVVLHELLPLPFTKRMVQKVADRIRSIEDDLARPFLIENISYYATPSAGEMSESDFLCLVLEKADCGLLLDVNNVYVNSKNHGYDAEDFIRQLPHERVVQIHVAGHLALQAPHPAAGLLLDTHGASVVDPVKELLQATLPLVGPVPVLLERDSEIPPLEELLLEVKELQRIYDRTFEAGS